jgi:hypothetical protein
VPPACFVGTPCDDPPVHAGLLDHRNRVSVRDVRLSRARNARGPPYLSQNTGLDQRCEKGERRWQR